jgi:hypothetical protein
LGFTGGIEEELRIGDEKKKVFEWLGYGGIQEDIPPEDWKNIDGLITLLFNKGRANNHFHNPLITDWDSAGLNSTIDLLRKYKNLHFVSAGFLTLFLIELEENVIHILTNNVLQCKHKVYGLL